MKATAKKPTTAKKTVARRSSNSTMRHHARAIAKKFGPVFGKLRKE